MDYRIIKRIYENGVIGYCPQYKRYFYWKSLVYYTSPEKEPLFFDQLESAKYVIRHHKKDNMKYKEKVLDDNII